MQQILASLKSQGWYVQLVPGYHYVPEWVFETYPNVQYVNQYGDAYSPEPGSFRVINAPFNPQAQNLIAGYKIILSGAGQFRLLLTGRSSLFGFFFRFNCFLFNLFIFGIFIISIFFLFKQAAYPVFYFI